MPATIAATRIHTPLNDVSRVDIVDAFPLFRQSAGTVRNSLGGSKQWVLADVETQVLAWKLHFLAGMGLYWGVNGPSYAVDVTFDGSVSGDSLQLTGSQSRAIAGLELGFGARLFFTLDVQQWSVDTHWVKDGWASHLEFDTSWKDAGRLNVDMTFDLISLLMGQIPHKGFGTTGKRFPTGLGLAAVDATSTNSFAHTGVTQLEPTFSAIWDLTKSVPALTAFKKTIVDRYHGVLAVGPTINLSLPTTINIVRAATHGSRYDLQAHDGVLNGIRTGPSTVGTSELEITFRHTASVAFGFGIAGSLTWLKVLCIGFSSGPLIDLLSLLGLTPTAGPYDHAVTAPVGGTSSAIYALDSGASYEVVFEELESVSA